MIKSFYVTLLGLCTMGAMISCGEKTEENSKHDSIVVRRERPVENVHMEPSALPNGEAFKIEYTKHGIDSILAMPDAGKLSTPKSAAEYNLSMPPKLTVPPHMLPAKDIKVIQETDSTAMISFAAEHNPMTGRMTMRKVTDGKSSVWLVESVIATHPGP